MRKRQASVGHIPNQESARLVPGCVCEVRQDMKNGKYAKTWKMQCVKEEEVGWCGVCRAPQPSQADMGDLIDVTIFPVPLWHLWEKEIVSLGILIG